MSLLDSSWISRGRKSIWVRLRSISLVAVLCVTAAVTMRADPAIAGSPTSLSNINVSVTGPSNAAGARTSYSISFVTSPTGGLSQSAGSSWAINFPTGTYLGSLTYANVYDVTTNQYVGNFGSSGSTQIGGSFFGGVVINAGDTMRVDVGGVYDPPNSGSYTASAWTSSDSLAASSSPYTIAANSSVSNVSLAITGPTNAANARTSYSITFTTSGTTGAMSSAVGSSWNISFPTGTNLNNITYGNVTDVTNNTYVGNFGSSGSTSVGGGFFSNVVIHAGDVLRVDLGGVYDPPYPGSYTASVSTSSDTAGATASTAYTVAANASVMNVTAVLNGPTNAAGARTAYSITFTTSATTGGMSNAVGSSWSINFPTGTNLNNITYGNVTDVTNNTYVGNFGSSGSTSIGGGFFNNVVIHAGDTLRVDIGGVYDPPWSGTYTVSVSTSSDTAGATTSTPYTVGSNASVSNVSATISGPTSATSGRSAYSISFTTSPTGGMSNAVGSSWNINFPTGTNLNNLTYGNVTDVTTNQYVGNFGSTGSSSIGGGFFNNVVIHPGDVLRVDIGGLYNPPRAGSYTASVSTSSDTAGATTSNSYSITPINPVLSPAVTLSNPGAGSGGVNYSITFTTSATGGMSPSVGSSWGITFPSGTRLNNLSYGNVTDVTTNTYVGNFGSSGSTSIGGGFFGNTSIAPGDVLRVDLGNVTNPNNVGAQTLSVSTTSDSSASVDFSTTSTASVSGTVVDANNSPVATSGVQACPADGSACQIASTAGDGTYTIYGLSTGQYTVIAFPPAHAAGAQSAPATITVTAPNSVTGVALKLASTAVMPQGSSITQNGGTQGAGTIPTLFWGSTSMYQTTGCPGGFGGLSIHATNTQTGQVDVHVIPLNETSFGSGIYQAQIPALQPDHGAMQAMPFIGCPGQSHLLPDTGAPQGGTTVLINGSGFSNATAVTFGGQPANSFSVINDNYIEAVSPPGSGTVNVTVTTPAGTNSIANYTYEAVTGLSSTSGSSAGGSTITITGTGLVNVTGVAFGNYLIPASQFQSVSPTQIVIVVPPMLADGGNTVNIQVINDFGVSAPNSSSQYTYQGAAPPPNPNHYDKMGCDPNDMACHAIFWLGTGFGVASGILGIAGGILGPKIAALNLIGAVETEGAEVAFGDELFGAVAVAIASPELAIALGVIGLALIACAFFCEDLWNAFIDPSGTIVDTNGNPISGATVSILRQGPTGFSTVSADSGIIRPAVNPETTDATGIFHWDALAGTYEVQANAPNCHAPGNPSLATATTPAVTIPPPAIGIVLALQCTGTTPPVPTVTGLSTSSGPASGGNVVHITGTGLGGVTSVSFGSAPATSVAVLSPFDVQAVAPAAPSANVNVTVTGPGGTSAPSSSSQYSYTEVAWKMPSSITYGAAIGSTQLNATGYIPGTFSYSPPAGTVLNAGSHILSATFTPTDTVHFSQQTISTLLTVNAAPLTVTAPNASTTYGTAPTLTPSYSGFVNGDGPSSLTTDPTCSVSPSMTPPVGTYATTCSGAQSANYTFSYASGTLTVTQAPLTVTANDASRLYGAPNPLLSATLSGFVLGQNLSSSGVTGSAACSTTAASDAEVGSYPITCTQGTLSASNYSFPNYVAGVLSVTQAPTSVIAKPVNITPSLPSAPTLSARLTSQVTSAPLANQLVTFTAGPTSTLLCSAFTDLSGIASCTPSVVAIPTLLVSGSYTASFAAVKDYAASTGTAQVGL
ncbi:MAG: beta strand repeat-containing protein [Actinomycetota bacterium]